MIDTAATNVDLPDPKWDANANTQARAKQTGSGPINYLDDPLEKQYDELNKHDDQFDLSDACLSMSLALMALTALTRKKWLLAVGLTCCSQRITIFCLPNVLTLNCTPPCLLPVP